MTRFHHSSFGWVESEDNSAQAFWALVRKTEERDGS